MPKINVFERGKWADYQGFCLFWDDIKAAINKSNLEHV